MFSATQMSVKDAELSAKQAALEQVIQRESPSKQSIDSSTGAMTTTDVSSTQTAPQPSPELTVTATQTLPQSDEHLLELESQVHACSKAWSGHSHYHLLM